MGRSRSRPQTRLGFDLGHQMVQFGDVIHLGLFFRTQLALLVAPEQFTHALHGGVRRAKGEDLARLRAAGQEGKNLAVKAGGVGAPLPQTEFNDFREMLPLRFHLAGEFIGQIDGHLHDRKINPARGGGQCPQQGTASGR